MLSWAQIQCPKPYEPKKQKKQKKQNRIGCLNEYLLNNKNPTNKLNKYPQATPKPKAFNLKNIHDQTPTNLLCWIMPKSCFLFFIFYFLHSISNSNSLRAIKSKNKIAAIYSTQRKKQQFSSRTLSLFLFCYLSHILFLFGFTLSTYYYLCPFFLLLFYFINNKETWWWWWYVCDSHCHFAFCHTIK